MPDEGKTPEGVEGAAPEGAGADLSALKERGFESVEDMAKALDKYKEDLSSYKPQAKQAKEYEAELAKLRKAEEERKEAEMSELEKAQAAQEKLKAELEQARSDAESIKRDALFRTTVSDHLRGVPDELQRIYRNEYTVATADGWDDEEDLEERLAEADKELKALLEKVGSSGGEKPNIFNWSRPEGQQGGKNESAATRTYREGIESGRGGLRALLDGRRGK